MASTPTQLLRLLLRRGSLATATEQPHFAALPGGRRSITSRSAAFAMPNDFNVLEGVAEKLEGQRIDRYFDNGFTVGGVDIDGSIICIGGTTLSWKPRMLNQVTPASLAVFELLRPAPDILVLGLGPRGSLVKPEIRQLLRANGILLESADTANAVSTYNILIEDGRNAAAALLTHQPYFEAAW